MKEIVRDGDKAAYTNPTDHLAYSTKILEQDRAKTVADATADAAADAAAAALL